MDENQNVTEETAVTQAPSEEKQESTHAVNRERRGTSALRSSIMTMLQISNIAFCISLGYLLVTFLMNSFGVNMSPFFGGMISSLTLGISSAIGIFYYIIIFLIATLIIGLMIGFVNINNNYSKLLKESNKQNFDIVVAPSQTISCMIGIVLVMFLLSFFSLSFIMNDMFSLPIICLIVSTVALIVSFVLIVVYIIKNRINYNKLSDIDKFIVKEQSKGLIKNKEKREKKRERKRMVGKLY
ncbi:MAG: hypothetical protein IJW24_02840 [Clostridia bacterium]|nr:hypothetical protein [Clostridia bacterium]